MSRSNFLHQLIPCALIFASVGGCTPSDTNSMTVSAPNGLAGIPFLANNVRGRLLFDDPAVAVRVKWIAFDGKQAADTAAYSYETVVMTRSVEKSHYRTYMLWFPLEGNDIVIKYLVDKPHGDAEWYQVRAPARFGYAEIVYAINYPDGSTSQTKRLRIVLPTIWHY